jgi:hypothetical protein
MALIREFWDFMKIRKKFWLAPIVMVLFVVSALVVLGTSGSVLTPFIYSIF